jgi:4-hydroxy-2-oxoheptanedioate aldolase
MRSFRERVQGGDTLVGTFVMELPVRACLEALAGAELDFAVLDLEHSATDLTSLSQLVVAAQACGLAAVVRLQADDLSTATRVLDMRPDGLMVPNVGSVDAARRVVAACRYQPLGERGLAPLVRHGGRFEEVDRQLLLAVQIEGVAGVEQAAEIAAVDGIDMVFLGPYDLSQAVGRLGQPRHPAVIALGRSVIDSVSEAAVGTFAADVDAAREWLAAGCSLVAVSTDGQLLLAGAQAGPGRVRAA